MKVVVVHEDGDREDRVKALGQEIRACIATGSMRVIGVHLEIQLPRVRIEEFVYENGMDHA